MGHPIQLKEAVIQKVLAGNKPRHEIAADFGVGRSTIGNWLRQYKKNGSINLKSKEKRPKEWSFEDRMSALIETGSMTPEEQTAWCRKKGIFPHHLKRWKQDAISGMAVNSSQKHTEKEKQLTKELSTLKRELSRKEKALAETAALLVLKKKAQEIWGEPEDD